MKQPSPPQPKTIPVVIAIGKVTFSEVIRDKILYNTLVFAFLLFGIAILASRLAFIQPDRVMIDFGISAVNLSCSFIGIFVGSTILIREFERRTVQVALSHPINRMQFVLGKFTGLAAVIAANWLLLSLAFLAILSMMAYDVAGSFSAALFVALLFNLIQSILLGAIALFLSTFTTTSISVMVCVGLYLIGNNISQIRALAEKTEFSLFKILLKGFALTLPNLEYFNLGTRATYGLSVELPFGIAGLSYGVVMIGFFLLLAGLTIQSRET